ncbi:MAG: hypothetical protein ACLSG5_18270 [Oscillospiraceae bacterium]
MYCGYQHHSGTGRGGCNCQFALKPDSFDYAVISKPEFPVPRAGFKATGYPIARSLRVSP